MRFPVWQKDPVELTRLQDQGEPRNALQLTGPSNCSTSSPREPGPPRRTAPGGDGTISPTAIPPRPRLSGSGERVSSSAPARKCDVAKELSPTAGADAERP
jgi:hypothetical protein